MLTYCLLVFLLAGCLNPFAPKLDENLGSDGSLISDQKNIDGIFQNLKYAYTFKDTSIYGGLLADDFTFSFRDYNLGVDRSWGRYDEMQATYGLFENTQSLDLVWNNIVSLTTDSTNIVRSFNLSITFNPTDIVFVDGRINLSLRKTSDGKWMITRWVDESNF